jgi:vanillate O-demethylase monooxygenase subunit
MTQPTGVLANSHAALAHAWHPVGIVADIAAYVDQIGRPYAAQIAGAGWALCVLGGQWVALPDRCPHRRVKLSAGRIVGDEVECGYHGWRFDGAGACTAVPALGDTAPPRGMDTTAAFGVVERYGWLWVAPAQPVTDLPVFAEADDPAYAWGLCPPVRTTAPAGIVADNFFDVAHFSYLHQKTFNISKPVTVERYAVSRAGWRTELVHETELHEDIGGESRVATYTATAPLAMHLRLDYPQTGERTAVVLIAQPESDGSTLIHKAVAVPASGGPGLLRQHIDFEVDVINEDIDMMENTVEPWLPLDLRLEAHTKADRAGVELRKMLSDFCAAASAMDAGSLGTASLDGAGSPALESA